MKFVDELYEYYKDRLTGDEEDAEIMTMSILEELSRKDLLQLIEDMDETELVGMVGLYILECLKAKMANEGVGQTKWSSSSIIH
ncbi:DUF6154 family protein [Anoxybacillus rupiensis]|jgi:Family of unknown function (DUF6154)|uniref:DUF6154 family protein n=1 Tax=Anoxybacteroides rupiense TaxID=311460 RepID=A0ABD5ITT8_9BACL|nr:MULTISPECIES: DUF6154 family protein [Anoxybacillus]KXG09381.1 hypothetical protein AT864_02335 [Anoxybacillus sp. P3H1B]MBS2771822.1 cytosolic protein [Anoxybacillus rupiensis]MDE8563810.1 DUF6154 family protein [Anoxybacillus rupiensis]MED5051407.1 DUF6154 family protein [Anoxybacillus rupiensis]OQM46065.1 cytosolic protein [Anoxybacillus sp. UARK-01]